jgi:magnesium-protoporphyrin IX monomethyl ester (oxidative) cyclase
LLWDLLQVYVTMYLNDCQRTAFYEGIGLDTKEFDMHVIIEVKELLVISI